MKVLFMGTPAFAAVSLKALLDAGHQVAAAVTRPDSASGRGLRTRPSAVKQLAAESGIAVLQPATVKGDAFLGQIAGLAPDIIVVAAFGRILPAKLLESPPLGAINVHASLLPRWRGAAPIAWAIARGDQRTGVTIMRMIDRLDAGGILASRSAPIGPDETAGELEARLAVLGAALLVETLPGVEDGTIGAVAQDESAATYAPLLRKEDGRIDWRLDAQELSRRVRAFNPWPGAQTTTPRSRRLLIWKAAAAGASATGTTPGTVTSLVVAGARGANAGAGEGILVACGGNTSLLLIDVQPEGRRRMTAVASASGRHLRVGDVLGDA